MSLEMVTDVLHMVSVVVLTVSALLAVARIVVGPTVLNRALANDVLVATLVCTLGLEAVISDHSSTLPILISLSLLGFISTVAISRFVARDIDEDSSRLRAPGLSATTNQTQGSEDR